MMFLMQFGLVGIRGSGRVIDQIPKVVGPGTDEDEVALGGVARLAGVVDAVNCALAVA